MLLKNGEKGKYTTTFILLEINLRGTLIPTMSEEKN